MSAILTAAREHFGGAPFTIVGDGDAIWDGAGEPIDATTLTAILERAQELEPQEARTATVETFRAAICQ